MGSVPKRVPHTVYISEGSNCQNPHPLGGAYIGEFEQADISPLTIQLLVHLGISTLAAASDLPFRITLYVLLKLAIVPGLCTVVNTQELDESVLIRLAHYHRKPLPKRKPLQPSLTRNSIDSKPSLVMGNPRKAGGKSAIARSNVLRWWVGTEK
jgi:hypothetical protein